MESEFSVNKEGFGLTGPVPIRVCDGCKLLSLRVNLASKCSSIDGTFCLLMRLRGVKRRYSVRDYSRKCNDSRGISDFQLFRAQVSLPEKVGSSLHISQ